MSGRTIERLASPYFLSKQTINGGIKYAPE
jgi:hypothetical protein